MKTFHSNQSISTQTVEQIFYRECDTHAIEIETGIRHSTRLALVFKWFPNIRLKLFHHKKKNFFSSSSFKVPNFFFNPLKKKKISSTFMTLLRSSWPRFFFASFFLYVGLYHLHTHNPSFYALRSFYCQGKNPSKKKNRKGLDKKKQSVAIFDFFFFSFPE